MSQFFVNKHFGRFTFSASFWIVQFQLVDTDKFQTVMYECNV